MPIYAFRCAACGHEFDRLQKLSDPDPDTCPECAAVGEVGRKLTAPSFRLAGSGWYETDFKKDGDKKRNLAEGGEGAGKAGPRPRRRHPSPPPNPPTEARSPDPAAWPRRLAPPPCRSGYSRDRRNRITAPPGAPRPSQAPGAPKSPPQSPPMAPMGFLQG